MTASRVLAVSGLISSVASFIGLGIAAYGLNGGLIIAFVGSAVMLVGNLVALKMESRS